MGFKENLKAELTYSGMPVKELAAKSGIKKHTIDNYLNTHNAIPAADAAVSIAKVLGVSVEYLITGYTEHDVRSDGCLSPESRLASRLVEQLDDNRRQIALTLLKALINHKSV